MPEARDAGTGLRLEEFALRHAPAAQAGCSLLSELQSRSLEPHVAGGHCRRFAIRPGFDLTLYDIVMAGGFPEGGAMPPGLTVTVLLEGAGQGVLYPDGHSPVGPAITYAGGTTYFCYGAIPVTGRGDLPPGSRFRAAELRLSLAFIEDIGMGEVFRRADAAHPLHRVGAAGIWVGTATTPEALAHAAARLIGQVAADADRQDLLVEKGALDILTATMELMRHPPLRLPLGSRDAARLREARGLILADPMRAWTIAGLARRVGLNEKKLKGGFRAQFGASVNGFLQEVRLRAAHRLLADGRTSVTEAALAVGYANPSHFALLFRRRYGIAPSSLKR